MHGSYAVVLFLRGKRKEVRDYGEARIFKDQCESDL